MRTKQEIREEIKQDCGAAVSADEMLLVYQQRQLELLFDIRDLLTNNRSMP